MNFQPHETGSKKIGVASTQEVVVLTPNHAEKAIRFAYYILPRNWQQNMKPFDYSQIVCHLLSISLELLSFNKWAYVWNCQIDIN